MSKPLLVTIAILLALYVTPYAWYRCLASKGNTNLIVGGSVRRPWGPQPTKPDFTFNGEVRSLDDFQYTSGPSGYDAVGWLAVNTGLDLAGPANTICYPIARLDHLFTGRHYWFRNEYGPYVLKTR
jgi:hypothetical protein